LYTDTRALEQIQRAARKPTGAGQENKKPLRAQRENRPGETLLLASGKIRLRTREPKLRKHQENEYSQI
jgi:hypothetical protein